MCFKRHNYFRHVLNTPLVELIRPIVFRADVLYLGVFFEATLASATKSETKTSI